MNKPIRKDFYIWIIDYITKINERYLKTFKCCFCGKTNKEVDCMITDNKHCICNECVDVCLAVVNKRKKEIRKKYIKFEWLKKRGHSPSLYFFIQLYIYLKLLLHLIHVLLSSCRFYRQMYNVHRLFQLALQLILK